MSRIAPPYDRVTEIASEDLRSIERGGVVAVDIVSPVRIEYGRLLRLVTGIRRRTDAAIAIRLPGGDSDAAMRVAMHAYPCGVRAILLRDAPCRAALWEYLASPLDLPGDLLAWLRLRRPVSAGAGQLIARIVHESPDHDSFEGLLARLEVPPRTLRYRFEHESLPGPSKWFHLGRLLDAQLRLQRGPSLDITEVANELGYADRLSFTNRVYRLFGVTAETSRQLLGLEWRFAAWWKRVCVSGNPSRQDLAVRSFDSGSSVAQ